MLGGSALWGWGSVQPLWDKGAWLSLWEKWIIMDKYMKRLAKVSCLFFLIDGPNCCECAVTACFCCAWRGLFCRTGSTPRFLCLAAISEAGLRWFAVLGWILSVVETDEFKVSLFDLIEKTLKNKRIPLQMGFTVKHSVPGCQWKLHSSPVLRQTFSVQMPLIYCSLSRCPNPKFYFQLISNCYH